ncbi:MAG: glycosyltransferase family 4 protein [Deltaproteobacteria bacterium]|nr:glycosyltransferase family 4 protein [Deltaproteobacteria bacterium]
MKDNKINILMLSAGMISGAFRRMMDIIENIDGKRFQIFVAYKPDYAEWGKHEIDLIIKAGAKIVSLRGKWLFGLRGFMDLWNILRKEQIDILHSWDVLGVPSRIIGKFAGVTIVEEFGNPPPALISEISLKHYLINKVTSVFVDGFVSCSNGVMKKYQDKKPIFLKNKVLSVVYNCVDVPHFDLSKRDRIFLRKKYSLGHHETILTNIGYFNEQKAQSDLLKAFKKVASNRWNVRLFLVGWGRLENELKEVAEDLGLKDRVIFTGKLTRPQVFEILSITDLFVLSSHWEGFGIVLAEAMAMGKPVLSTDTDGSREVVENGKTGVLVPIKRPEILAQAILDLLEKPELMAKMGEEGLKRVTKLFNCEQFIKGYEDFYKAVLSRN